MVTIFGEKLVMFYKISYSPIIEKEKYAIEELKLEKSSFFVLYYA